MENNQTMNSPKIYLDKVYYYYDGIITFTAKDDLDKDFVFVAYEEDENDGITKYIGVALSPTRLTSLLGKVYDMREAFVCAEEKVFYIAKLEASGDVIVLGTKTEITEDELYSGGVYL